MKDLFNTDNYVGKYIALDDMDRLVSFEEDIDKVIENVKEYSNFKDKFGVRIYKIIDINIRKVIMEIIS